MKRINPFKKIYDTCNVNNSREVLNKLPQFPRYIDIELTNHCNYKCLMCPVGTGSMNRNQGFMSEAIFNKILDEIKLYKTPLRFIRWGEPTIHNEYINYIKKAKENGVICHVNTNGTMLEEKQMKKLIDIKLDSIKFSFQGVDRKTYIEMRNKDYFDNLIENIKKLYDIRKDNYYPYIQVSTTITYESKEMVEKFVGDIEQYCDMTNVGRTILDKINIEKVNLNDSDKARLIELKRKQSSSKKRFNCCPEVFDKLSINWDGTVTACCSDYDNLMIVGDLKKNSLKEIWLSEKMNEYREILSEKKYEKLELCKNCYDYMSVQT
ncbi:S-adenosyl-L-methionine-dependent 2-deoxy-scyllo-inosamine dehydrogenase [Andreesenia angusta]|uniref:S-adenosyl-L-methionine-dependent 2-deoxy-scyllo-inosamine dehydrogenase n=1 Tax=Andreesenia angusta TaxID=39480 RepID=A0A1S1V627_9FIRM|nr:radical SAM protein [Andreesenia angusta]OHW61974.1 S-adenosyl-L-methionine-dependent 2-deoxy-scyllo-inosamine dehydrogenase [Andreesenia angusta]